VSGKTLLTVALSLCIRLRGYSSKVFPDTEENILTVLQTHTRQLFCYLTLYYLDYSRTYTVLFYYRTLFKFGLEKNTNMESIVQTEHSYYRSTKQRRRPLNCRETNAEWRLCRKIPVIALSQKSWKHFLRIIL